MGVSKNFSDRPIDHFSKQDHAKAVGSQPLNDIGDSVYLVNITIGSSEQQFTMLLDTSSANLWVPDMTCFLEGCDKCDRKFCRRTYDLKFVVNSEYCGYYCANPACCGGNVSTVGKTRFDRSMSPSVLCPKSRLFDSSKSSSYRKNGQSIKISYLDQYLNSFSDDNVAGFLGVDTVSLGSMGTNQLVIPKTTFAQINKIADYFYIYPYDGILGLGFTSLAAGNVVPPFVS